MKKIILGTLLAIILVGCGDSDLYTSYEYKKNLAVKIYPDNGEFNKEAHKEYAVIYNKLIKANDPKAHTEIKLWIETLKKRVAYVEKLQATEKAQKVKVDMKEFWKTWKEEAATPYPSLND